MNRIVHQLSKMPSSCPASAGKSLSLVDPASSPFCKNILLRSSPKSLLKLAPSCPAEGRLAIVTNVGAGCGGRGCALDEWRLRRTAKSCGPDAPTLASSSREASFSGATVANKPGHRGEREGNRKTIARGMPDVSGVTVVTNACAFYHCTRGCGRAERPAFPAPSFSGRTDDAQLGRCPRRENKLR
jgi:hypothetical protein